MAGFWNSVSALAAWRCLSPGGACPCTVSSLSEPMVARLRAQPGADQVGVTIGDIATHYWVIDGQTETFSSPHRYLWPSELDLMARIAGLTLRERWGSWQREPFTSDSSAHISVWEKPTGVVSRH